MTHEFCETEDLALNYVFDQKKGVEEKRKRRRRREREGGIKGIINSQG